MAETTHLTVRFRYHFAGPANPRRRNRDWRTGWWWRPRVEAAADRRTATALRRVDRRAARRRRRG